MRLGIIVAAATLTSVAALGCKGLATGAAEEFGRTYSCPESQIVVKPRDNLKWSAVLSAARTKAVPLTAQSVDSTVDVFQATGCGHDVLMGCWRTGQRRGSSSSSSVSCLEAPSKP